MSVMKYINTKKLLFLFVCLTQYLIVSAQGTFIDFNSIPKNGTILIYTHNDDDLIWLLPFWSISEKFIGGAMPRTPSFETIISQQQDFMDNNGYNIEYESNWIAPWGSITQQEYDQYYWHLNSAYQYLENEYLKTSWWDEDPLAYREQIDRIKAKLEPYIADPGVSRIITHDNWGEYGHQQHIAVNRAVRELAVKYRKDVWMLGCTVNVGDFTDVYVPDGVTYTLASFDQPDLYTGIRDIYINNGCWTWYGDVVPSGDHKFIKIVDGGVDKSDLLTGETTTISGHIQLKPGSYIFDGEDDYLTLPGNNYPSFTIAMWVRPDQIYEMDISKMAEYPSSDEYDRNFYLNGNGKISAAINDGSTETVTSNTSLTSGEWYHISMTSNGNDLRLFINGILENSISTGTAITDYSTPEFVLGQPTVTDSWFKGQINDVKLYNRVLSDFEIAELSGRVYTITTSAGAGGTISPSGEVDAGIGSNVTFTITPDTGFGISDVRIDDVPIGMISTYTFNYVAEDHTISASFISLNPYTITSTAGTGGTIDPSGTKTVYEGTSQTYTISAGIGYRIDDVVVDGTSVGAVSSYTFTNISGNHTIAASFVPIPTYTIIISEGSGGSISPGGTVSVNEGSNVTFNIDPDEGYYIVEVVVDGNSVGAVSSYTFTNISAGHTISATFAIRTFTLTASAGANGTINPSGVVSLNYGSSQSYTLTPSSGYKVSNVLVDNVSVGSPSSYTFSNIDANHVISVSFTMITNIINASAGQGGTITPQGNVSVNYGASQTFSFAAATGYYISDVKVDNASQGAITSYTFNNVTSGHTISAVFTAITFSLTGSAGSGGSISPSGTTTVNYGSDRTFTVIPATGFVISDIKVDNVSLGPVSSYTFNYVTADHNIEASFKTATCTLSANAGSGGSISPPGTTTMNYGTSLTYTLTPGTGYQISDLRIDGSSAGAVPTYTFNNISANHTISALFSIITYTLNATAGTGGSISPAGNVSVDYGSNHTFSITPDEGFNISDVRVDNNSIGPVTSYTFSNILKNHSIVASFRHITFSINATTGSGGTISPDGSSLVNYGSDMTFNIVPNEGFLISDVKADNISVGKVSTFTFSRIISVHTISATFIPITFTIKGSTGEGGTISSSGNTTIQYGKTLTYTITPDTGFEIADVLVDNHSVGPVQEYTFVNIVDDHTITAVFKVITYNISVSSGTGGSVSPGENIRVDHGLDQEFSIVPDSGYKILDLIVDDESVGPLPDYAFKNITSHHSISAMFKLMDVYTINARAGEGGLISPSGETKITEGSDMTYQIIPAIGYRIYEVVVDNLSAGIVTEYTFNNLSSDHTINVTFSTKTEVKVYPNPFIAEFNLMIASPGEKLFEIVIADILGKTVYRQKRVPGNSVTPVQFKGSSGIYILMIYYNGAKVATFKIIKS